MRFSSLVFAALALRASNAQKCQPSPYISPKMVMHGSILDSDDIPSTTKIDDVTGCCVLEDEIEGACSASRELMEKESARFSPKVIGKIPQMDKQQTLAVLEDAKQAWKGGSGTWPQMTLKDRILAVEVFVKDLKENMREEIIMTLMWEIGKNLKDATAEFDRTMAFVEKVIETIRSDDEFSSNWQSISSTKAFIRWAAVGIVICLGPYNYPLNETYATLIPALLMGNIVIMKVPTIGGLSHLLTMEAFAKALPPGTMNFVSGGGRATMPPLMATGDIDMLAFIGGSNAADRLIQQHPKPHRLKIFLQLEAKNMAIFLPDMFGESKSSEMKSALDQCILGSLSYNGQRCTALKLFFIPKAHGDSFADSLAKRVESMSVGLPWHDWSSGEGGSPSYSSITPLPNQKRVDLMQRLIKDAVDKGAKIMNKDGGKIIGGPNSTLMVPAVLYPVTSDMDIYEEEQFGPVVPITTYDSLDEVLDYGLTSPYGQQVSIFTSTESVESAAKLVDQFSAVYGKININSQCGRSPDTLPFSGRRSSAMGVMSVKDALREFSVPTVVAYKEGSEGTTKAVKSIEGLSKFLQPL